MIKTYSDNLGIHSIEWNGIYLRTGAHFILTATWRCWGIEICRCKPEEPWSPWGSVSRQVRLRFGGIRVWIFLGHLPKITVPDRGNQRFSIVSAKDTLIGPTINPVGNQLETP